MQFGNHDPESVKAFENEMHTYLYLKKSKPHLKIIPRFHSLDDIDKTLYFYYINERPLGAFSVSDKPAPLETKRFRQNLRELHSVGVSHGDIALNNMTFSGHFYNFAHSHRQTECTIQQWKSYKKADLAALNACFREWNGLRVASILREPWQQQQDDGVITVQEEVAELLLHSICSQELVEMLVQQPPVRSARLEYAIVRQLACNTRWWDAVDRDRTGHFDAAQPPPSVELWLLYAGQIALCRYRIAVHNGKEDEREHLDFFQKAIDFGHEHSSARDSKLLRIQFWLIQYLRAISRRGDALERCEKILDDLDQTPPDAAVDANTNANGNVNLNGDANVYANANGDADADFDASTHSWIKVLEKERDQLRQEMPIAGKEDTTEPSGEDTEYQGKSEVCVHRTGHAHMNGKAK